MTGRGCFITLEGGEGTGKSTQSQRLSDYLEDQGYKTLLTREPGGTPGASAIRELFVSGEADRWNPVSEALLMYAARQDHITRLIEPALAKGTWVICDRFSDSTMAYQGYAKQLGAEWIGRLDELAINSFQPDVTLLLDLPVETGLARAAERGGPDRFEKMGMGFHQTLRTAFLDIAAQNPDRITVVDANGDVDTVANRIIAAIKPYLLTHKAMP